MQKTSRAIRSTLGGTHYYHSTRKSSASPTAKHPTQIGSGRYQEGDRVLVTYKDGRKVKTKILSPLKPDGSSRTPQAKYDLRHADIIGKPANRQYVKARDDAGQEGSTGFRITYPSFEQFVSLAPRTVTPIYSSYSATMVSLLDIHVSPPQPGNDPQTSDIPPLEILEAGTGHGSLTIHLSRAIAAANPPPPILDEPHTEEDIGAAWTTWRSSRRAIVHTVEYDASRSRDASDLIHSFRGGLYWPHIDFHSGGVGAWVKKEQQSRQTTNESHNEPVPFLDIVCLDLPGVHDQIAEVAKAMKPDSQLLVYVPQITQVAACQNEIERLQLPFSLDHVLELGEGISNGREWDVRFIKTRAEQKGLAGTSSASRSESGSPTGETPSSSSEAESEDSAVDAGDAVSTGEGAGFPVMVCRPLVGKMIMGGAFVALWRKRERSVRQSSVDVLEQPKST